MYGGSLGFGRPILYGSLNGKLAYAVGSDDLLGGAEYLKRVHREHGNWTLRAFGGRIMSVMDGDHPDVGLATARALIDGRDGQHYFREDGFEAASRARGRDLARGGRLSRYAPVGAADHHDMEPHQPSDLGRRERGRRVRPSARARRLRPARSCRGCRSPRSSITAPRAKAIGSDLEYRPHARGAERRLGTRPPRLRGAAGGVRPPQRVRGAAGSVLSRRRPLAAQPADRRRSAAPEWRWRGST